jgi:hypothetical protein
MKRQSKRTRTRTTKKQRSQLVRTINSLQTVEQFFAMPERSQKTLIGVANTVSEMRADGISLTKASRQFKVNPRTVKRLAGSALRKLGNGQYAAKPNDRIFRVITVLAKRKGLVQVATMDFRQAKKASKHSAAVESYRDAGEASALAKFKRKYIVDASGKRIALMTDLDDLDRLGSAGELSFESLYARNL